MSVGRVKVLPVWGLCQTVKQYQEVETVAAAREGGRGCAGR